MGAFTNSKPHARKIKLFIICCVLKRIRHVENYFEIKMSVGASKKHNLILYLDEITSECKCMSRFCDVCNPNPTTDLIFGLKDDLLSLEERLAQKEARIKELERMVDGLKNTVDDLVKIHNRKQFASGAFD